MTSIQPIAPYRASEVNAVSIQINNPKVITSNETSPQVQNPEVTTNSQIYTYPQAPIYEVPKQAVYQVQPIKEVSTPPPSAIVQPAVAKVPAVAPVKTAAPAQKVEVKAPEKMEQKIDINDFIAKLTDADYEKQATAMESIAIMAQNSPQQATALLDVKVVDTLLGIMQKDTSKLEGPSAKQIESREKIMNGKTVSDAEKAEANKITPMELAERNKQYAMYTVATLQKLFIDEIKKIDGSIVPLTELPGASAIVEQVKNNPNPMIRAAGIDALSYIQRPDYKQDLTTLFNVAKNDKDANVQKTATKALEKLAQLKDTPPEVNVSADAKPQPAAEAPKPATDAAKTQSQPAAQTATQPAAKDKKAA